MPDEKNDDLEIPHFPEVTPGRPILTNNYKAGTLPIFWGPGQLTPVGGVYTEPVLEKWRAGEILAIPKVARFLYATQSAYNSDDYPEPGDPVPTEEHYKIFAIKDHLPPFPHDFIVEYVIVRNGVDLPHQGNQLFSTNQFVMINDVLVNVGSTLVVGKQWATFGPAFNYIVAGVNGPGWYPNSGIPPTVITFF